MRNFLFGVLVGAMGAFWFTQMKGRIDVDRQFGQMQERANAVLNESRRILEETRQELASALESGRQSVQQKTERLRNPAAGETGTTGTSEPNQPAS